MTSSIAPVIADVEAFLNGLAFRTLTSAERDLFPDLEFDALIAFKSGYVITREFSDRVDGRAVEFSLYLEAEIRADGKVNGWACDYSRSGTFGPFRPFTLD